MSNSLLLKNIAFGLSFDPLGIELVTLSAKLIFTSIYCCNATSSVKSTVTSLKFISLMYPEELMEFLSHKLVAVIRV